ncbi:MAG: polysaccharide biosynthesis/export family protein [Bacteroidales bacterium]|nr:polysaccharide biosynthesis/export family protein [Bacteroidales bacterium]
MKKLTTFHPGALIALICSLYLLTSCAPVHKLKFVADGTDGAVKNDYFNDRSEKTIQPFDYLYIKIISLDEKTNSIFNERSYNIDTELLSYAVDARGDITVPFIGNINVKDLTINHAREKIEKSLQVYLNNISVMVRFVSNKVTLLGEVNRPGQHSFFDEKVTVFQAIGFAGGTSGFGDLSNVTLVREKDNVIKYYYLDLTKKNIASSEYYYLLPNDILIINPIKAKYRSLRDYALDITSTLLTSISATLSIILVVRELQ